LGLAEESREVFEDPPHPHRSRILRCRCCYASHISPAIRSRRTGVIDI